MTNKPSDGQRHAGGIKSARRCPDRCPECRAVVAAHRQRFRLIAAGWAGGYRPSDDWVVDYRLGRLP